MSHISRAVEEVAEIDCAWYIRGKLAFLFEVEWTAMLGEPILRRHARIPQDDGTVRFLVIAPERTELVRHKLERSPLLREAFDRDNWHVLKWNHLRAFLGRDEPTLDALEPYLGLDPVAERSGEQLDLFGERRGRRAVGAASPIRACALPCRDHRPRGRHARPPPMPMETTVTQSDQPSSPVDQLADRFWDDILELNPTTATVYGDERYNDRLEDPSPAGRPKTRELMVRTKAAAEAISPDGLPVEDRITRDMLIVIADQAIEQHDQGVHRLARRRPDQRPADAPAPGLPVPAGRHPGAVREVPRPPRGVPRRTWRPTPTSSARASTRG